MIYMNSKEKGFTLIELLAVIVILAIIALIITPIITGVIKNAKDSSDLRSAEAYIKAGENYYAKASTSGGTLDSNVIDDLEVSSNKATDVSSVVVNSDGTTDMAIIIDDKCYRKTFSESIKDIKVTDITNDEDKANCSVPLASDYAFLAPACNKPFDGSYGCGSILFNNTTIRNYSVKSISKVDVAPTTYAYSWDASDQEMDGNTSIMAYAVGNDTDKYDLYLVSSKPIASPKYSTSLFADIGIVGDTDLSWLHTYFTTDMNNMFHWFGQNYMISIKLGDNFDTSNVTNMYSMFYNCGRSKLASYDFGSNFDTSNVTNMGRMFYHFGENELLEFKLGDKFDTSNVTTMESMFAETGMYKMTTMSLGDKFSVDNATNYNNLFSGTGSAAMTSLDLGPAFKKVAYSVMGIDSVGASGCQIKVSSDIYYDSTHFKTSKNSSETVTYNNGTLVSAY